MSTDNDPEVDPADAIAETLKDLPAEVKSRVMQSALSLVEATHGTLADLPAEIRAKALLSALYLLGVNVEEQFAETQGASEAKLAADAKAIPFAEVWRDYLGKQLFRAVDHNDRAAAEEALKIGADVDYVSSSFHKGVTTFCYACLQGNEEMIRLFLDEGKADPNAQFYGASKSPYPISPLMMAVRDRRKEVVKLLLEKGADPNYLHHFETEDGTGYWTPLGVAVADDSLGIVVMLLEYGANEEPVTAYQGQISTAMDVARQHSNEAVTLILKKRQPEKEPAAIPSAKSSALPPRDAALVNVNEQLLSAIERDDLYDALEALKNGAYVYYVHNPGSGNASAFCQALERGNAEMVGLFLDHGADPNLPMSNVYQYQYYPIAPLMLAVWRGHEAVVRLLLEKGADPNCEHRFGREDDDVGTTTPLGKAIENGSVKLVETLLDHGARDVAYESVPWHGPEEFTALAWARRKDKPVVVSFLEERQGAVDFGSPFEAEEAPAQAVLSLDKLKFDIKFVSQPRWYDEWSCELNDGEVKFEDQVDYFTTSFTEGSWSQGTYEGQWSEAVIRLLNGYDRTVFVLNFGTIDGFQTWLMWREGEKVYAAFDWAHKGEFDPDHPYDKLASYHTEKQHRKEFRELTMQDIRDFFLLRGMASLETREQLGRPCAQCGKEMQRCHRCGNCLACSGGVGNVETGYCKKCAGD